MLIRVIDFETCGKEPPDCEVIEIGWCDVTERNIGRPRSILVQHARPIDIETMAVHHLQERDFNEAMSHADAFSRLGLLPRQEGTLEDAAPIFCAHSIKFERACWPGALETAQWICTYKCALRLWPESPRHSNQVLRYFLGFTDLHPELAMPPHRAGPDAYVTAHILAKCLERAPVGDLIKWSAEPALLPRVTFGRHRGTPWSEVDDGLLYWVLARDFDEDVLHTARHELDRRTAAEDAAMAATDEADDAAAAGTKGEEG